MNAEYEQQLMQWAHKYDGYKRLASSPEQLWEVVRPLREAYQAEGTIPEWAGVDLLRGWSFYIARAHRFTGGPSEIWVSYPEITAIVEAINHHPAVRKSELAPVPSRG